MIVVPLKQGTQQWKDWRYGGITATDICVIMGSSKYKSVHQLWTEKVTCSDSTISTYIMREGSRMEPIARKWIEVDKNITLDSPCVHKQDTEFARCSLDGLDSLNEVLYEIKCPHSKDKVSKARLKGEVDLAWIHQVQWQLYVTGYKTGYIVVWDKDLEIGHYIEVTADKELHTKMQLAAANFWFDVICLEEPLLSENELIENNDEAILKLLEMYNDISKQMLALEKQQKNIKALITKDGNSFRCRNFVVKEYTSNPSYDYKKMIEDGINLDEYKKKETKHFRIMEKNPSVK